MLNYLRDVFLSFRSLCSGLNSYLRLVFNSCADALAEPETFLYPLISSMSGQQSTKSELRYGERRMVNLYRESTLSLWEQAQAKVRERYDTEGATQGQIAAQAWADWLGVTGPLEGDTND